MQRNSTAHRTIHADIATPCRQGLTTEALGSGRERAERRAPLSASANSSKPRDSPPHPRGRRRSIRLCQLPRSWHRPPPRGAWETAPNGAAATLFPNTAAPPPATGPAASLRLAEASQRSGELGRVRLSHHRFFPLPAALRPPSGRALGCKGKTPLMRPLGGSPLLPKG